VDSADQARVLPTYVPPQFLEGNDRWSISLTAPYPNEFDYGTYGPDGMVDSWLRLLVTESPPPQFGSHIVDGREVWLADGGGLRAYVTAAGCDYVYVSGSNVEAADFAAAVRDVRCDDGQPVVTCQGQNVDEEMKKVIASLDEVMSGPVDR
jgi:hypothetical protein